MDNPTRLEAKLDACTCGATICEACRLAAAEAEDDRIAREARLLEVALQDRAECPDIDDRPVRDAGGATLARHVNGRLQATDRGRQLLARAARRLRLSYARYLRLVRASER